MVVDFELIIIHIKDGWRDTVYIVRVLQVFIFQYQRLSLSKIEIPCMLMYSVAYFLSSHYTKCFQIYSSRIVNRFV